MTDEPYPDDPVSWTEAGKALLADPDLLAHRIINAIEAEARNRGYREGRLAVWQELHEHIQENEEVARREVALSDGPLPTADEVRGILAPEAARE